MNDCILGEAVCKEYARFSRDPRALRNWQAHGLDEQHLSPRPSGKGQRDSGEPQTEYSFVPHPGGEAVVGKKIREAQASCEDSTPSARTTFPDTEPLPCGKRVF